MCRLCEEGKGMNVIKTVLIKKDKGYQVACSKYVDAFTHDGLTFAEAIMYIETILEEDLEKSREETRIKNNKYKISISEEKE